MDPNVLVATSLAAIDELIKLIGHVRGQGGLTDDQLSAQVDQQNLTNADAIKKLLAL